MQGMVATSWEKKQRKAKTSHIYIYIWYDDSSKSSSGGHDFTRTLILELWTTRMDTSSRTLFVREGQCRDVHVTSNIELRNNVRLLLNVELRNYVISRQIVI